MQNCRRDDALATPHCPKFRWQQVGWRHPMHLAKPLFESSIQCFPLSSTQRWSLNKISLYFMKILTCSNINVIGPATLIVHWYSSLDSSSNNLEFDQPIVSSPENLDVCRHDGMPAHKRTRQSSTPIYCRGSDCRQ